MDIHARNKSVRQNCLYRRGFAPCCCLFRPSRTETLATAFVPGPKPELRAAESVRREWKMDKFSYTYRHIQLHTHTVTSAHKHIASHPVDYTIDSQQPSENVEWMVCLCGKQGIEQKRCGRRARSCACVCARSVGTVWAAAACVVVYGICVSTRTRTRTTTIENQSGIERERERCWWSCAQIR